MLRHLNSIAVPPSRTVLLGGGGFLGKVTSRVLAARGVDVFAPTSRELDLTGPAAGGVLGAAMRSSDTIIMLAAITPDRDRNWTAMLPNIRMAAAVCSAIKAVAPAHVVYVSSEAVYAFSDDDTAPIDEETPVQPQDLYGAMHVAREMMFRAVCEPRLAILRPTAVYGAEDTHNAYGPNRFLRTARSDGVIHLFGQGEETRDHVHVEDVAEIVLRVICLRSIGVLNVASGRSWSFSQLAELIGGRCSPAARIIPVERRQPITHRTFDVSATSAAFPEFQFRRLEYEIAAGLQPDTGASMSKF